MRHKLQHLVLASILITLVGCSVFAPSTPTEAPTPTSTPEAAASEGRTLSGALEAIPTEAIAPTEDALPAEVPTPTEAAAPTSAAEPPPTDQPPPAPVDPFSLVSQDSLLAYLEDLTAIQPYSGWRNSASEGEAQALDYVADTLGGFEVLQGLGLELERQRYHVFLGTELWETRLHLTVDGQETEVPADGLRGPRDEIDLALRFDSDGVLNDSERNPVVVEGPVIVVRSADEIRALGHRDVDGKVVFLDYEAIDKVVQGGTGPAVEIGWDLLEEEPAGLVLVTQFSNEVGRSHGSFVGDTNALNWVETDAAPPTLYVRLEDLAPAGIQGWDDLSRIEAARLTWDADVFSPAPSENLAARIPGTDTSQAVILGAHIDSPNAPGAMDDGSGSAVLLEVARVLDASGTQPPVDLYLVWFGSEELGLYGSSHYALTHQELLDRTVAMLQIDCLSRPLDGIPAEISLVTWSYGRLGDDRLPWPDHLAGAAARHGVDMVIEDRYYLYSDNSSFAGFDVPHADLIYADEEAMEATGSLHYAAHIHDPYDTVELAAEVSDALEQMALVALAGALEAPQEIAALRVAPPPDRRAVFVASHTESVHMAPSALTDLGMALAWEGFDLDVVPYGQPVIAADLEGADLVVVLPVVDYASPEGDVTLYDEAWSPEEVDVLEAYAAGGGLLVLTNSLNRLKYSNRVLDANEDWPDANALAERFGIVYRDGGIDVRQAQAEGQHPLVAGVSTLDLANNNGVPFELPGGAGDEVLAQAGGAPVVALVDYGSQGGQVLVLADVGLLGAEWGPPANMTFWRNLAQYARQ